MIYYGYLLFLMVVAGTTLLGASFAWRRRGVPGALGLALLLVCVTGWIACDVLAALSPNAEWALFFESRLRFLFASTSPLAIFMVALDYTGRWHWLNPARWVALLSVPISVQVAIWLGPPDIFIGHVEYAYRDGFYMLADRQFGPWFLLHASHGYVLIGIALGLLVNQMIRTLPPYRNQAVLLFAGLMVLVVTSVVRTLGGGLLLNYDIIVLGFVITAALWLASLFFYGLLDISPVARHRLMDMMDDVLIVLDRQYRVVDFNPTATRVFAWERQDVIGGGIDAVLPHHGAEIRACAATQLALQVELHIQDRTFDLRISPLYYRQNHLSGYLCVLRDMTERAAMMNVIHANETAVRAFQEKVVELHEITVELAQIETLRELYFRAIQLGRARLGFDRLAIFMLDDSDPPMVLGTFGTDAQGNTRDEGSYRHPINNNQRIHRALIDKVRARVWEDVELWDKRAVVGHGWNAMAVLWNGADSIGALVADNLFTQTPFTPYTLELMALYGKTLGYLVANLRAQNALKESEARSRRLAEAAFESILIHEQGTITDVNPAFGAMFGYAREEFIGRSVGELVIEESRAKVLDHALSEKPAMYEVVGRRKDGSVFPAEIFSNQVPFQGRAARVAAIRDLTHRTQIEQHKMDLALQRERVQLLASFITHAAHEFRTPLSVIDSHAYLLRRVSDPARQADYLQGITEQVSSLSALVEALIMMARLDSGITLEKKPVDVNFLVKSLAASYQHRLAAAELTHALHLAETLPVLQGDGRQLTQAFAQVLNNALRYTPEGGAIRITTACEDQSVVVEIADTGIGMTDEQQNRAFERFYRVDEAHSTRGFGLGLPMARRIMELHGGTITVRSAVGEGSTFRMLLPVRGIDDRAQV